MREACALLVGEHDFRNMCKIDPCKQITSYKRRVLSAQINELHPEEGSDLFVLDLVGTAFLYNQVRNVMAVLFLVGARLEDPSIVSALLNVDSENPKRHPRTDEALPVVDCRPLYEIADAMPLVLWKCGYADNDVSWRTDIITSPTYESASLYRQMSDTFERSRIITALYQQFLEAASEFHHKAVPGAGAGALMPCGGGVWKRQRNYVPLLKRERLEHVDVVNARWLARKGGAKTEAEPDVQGE
jgi:tRNA pseudouridine38/39 synthase